MYSITCIVGTSGCGKSTLVGILSGLLLPYQGCFKIGNHIIVDHNNNNNSNIYSNNNHDSDYLHRKVGVVQQMDRSLISGTITDNIEYGKVIVVSCYSYVYTYILYIDQFHIIHTIYIYMYCLILYLCIICMWLFYMRR